MQCKSQMAPIPSISNLNARLSARAEAQRGSSGNGRPTRTTRTLRSAQPSPSSTSSRRYRGGGYCI
jgi:hypothetical protein